MRYHLYRHIEGRYMLVDFSKVDINDMGNSRPSETYYLSINDVSKVTENDFVHFFMADKGIIDPWYEKELELILTTDDHTTITPEYYPELFI